jgi:hypothetical protein
MDRPSVEALHERDVGLLDQWTQQTGDEVRAEVADVRVEPAHEIARGGVDGLPHRVALARARASLGQDVRDGHDPRAFPGRDRRGGVRRPVVDHQHLVDEGDRLHQGPAHGGHDVADRDFLVAGREADGDRQPGRGLGLGQVGRIEVVMAPGHGE